MVLLTSWSLHNVQKKKKGRNRRKKIKVGNRMWRDEKNLCLSQDFMAQIQGHWDFKPGTLVTAQDKRNTKWTWQIWFIPGRDLPTEG